MAFSVLNTKYKYKHKISTKARMLSILNINILKYKHNLSSFINFCSKKKFKYIHLVLHFTENKNIHINYNFTISYQRLYENYVTLIVNLFTLRVN